MQSGRLIEAAELIRQAAVLNPAAARYPTNLAQILRSIQQPGLALASADRAIAADPDFPNAHLGRALSLLDLKRPADALDSLRLPGTFAMTGPKRGVETVGADWGVDPPAPFAKNQPWS